MASVGQPVDAEGRGERFICHHHLRKRSETCGTPSPTDRASVLQQEPRPDRSVFLHNAVLSNEQKPWLCHEVSFHCVFPVQTFRIRFIYFFFISRTFNMYLSHGNLPHIFTYTFLGKRYVLKGTMFEGTATAK